MNYVLLISGLCVFIGLVFVVLGFVILQRWEP